MRQFFLICLWLFCSTAVQAQKGYILPPPSFDVGNGAQGIFINILWARYTITFDVEHAQVVALTQFEFQNWDEGAPLFDLVPEPIEITLDGERVQSRVIKTPDRETKLRLIDSVVSKGNHMVTIRHRLTQGVKFKGDRVNSGFWYSDLDDRQFLEQFLPSNLEFDTYFVSMRVRVIGTTIEHVLLTNGVVTPINENEWQIRYPEFYNTASLFFHLGPRDEFQISQTEFKSVSGKVLPVIVYSKSESVDLDSFATRSHATLQELERDYGSFPHEKLIVYANPQFDGGMEYAGATITNLWALSHEITHSYFGRAVMPANGNAGWIDEAVASWRDARYPRLQDPGYSSGNLARFSAYRRTTTEDAYTLGRNFIGYLDNLFAQRGSSMKAFLRDLVAKRAYEPISTPFFKSWLEAAYGAKMDDDFRQYVYNREAALWDDEEKSPRNPYHPRLSQSYLESFY